MKDFEKILEIWNKNNFRGAKKKLAAALGVADTTMSAWCSGRLLPAQDKIGKMSLVLSKEKEVKKAGFDVSVDGLKKMFGIPERKRQRIGFEVLGRTGGETEAVPILSAVYHGGSVIFFDDSEYSPSEENPMLAKIKITEDAYAPNFYAGDILTVDSRGKAEEGNVVLAKIDVRRVLARITRGALVCLDSKKEAPQSSAQVLGVVVKRETAKI